jgi:hypothetical protein
MLARLPICEHDLHYMASLHLTMAISCVVFTYRFNDKMKNKKYYRVRTFYFGEFKCGH